MRYYSGIFSCYGNDGRKLDHTQNRCDLGETNVEQFSILIECSLLEVTGREFYPCLYIHQTAKRIDALAIKNRKLVRY